MKPILWLDAQVLRFFTKVAKDSNWLMGWDNYFLAKTLLTILGGMSVFIHNWLGLLVLLSIYCPLWLAVNISKSDSEKAQLRQAKVLSDHLIDQNFRLSSLVLLILSISLGELLSYLTPAVTGMFLVAYLISIDKPPFQKSQAWQKIKSWFSFAVAAPQAEPIPVQSN